jgi:hypothetical protein
MRTLLTFLVGFGVSGAAYAADADLNRQVVDLLSAYETPASAEDYQKLGEGVETELIAIANDEDQALSRRSSAVHALGYVPSDAGRVYVETTLSNPEQPSLMRRQAAFALATGWPEDNHASLTVALADEDTQLRIAAAKALKVSTDPLAPAALEARLEVEDNDAVKKHLIAKQAE